MLSLLLMMGIPQTILSGNYKYYYHNTPQPTPIPVNIGAGSNDKYETKLYRKLL